MQNIFLRILVSKPHLFFRVFKGNSTDGIWLHNFRAGQLSQ